MSTKLYQVQATLARIQPFETHLFTNQGDARKRFNQLRKDNRIRTLHLSRLTVRTDLKLQDWIDLLESDAPGNTMTLAPRDLIERNEVLDSWCADSIFE